MYGKGKNWLIWNITDDLYFICTQFNIEKDFRFDIQYDMHMLMSTV